MISRIFLIKICKEFIIISGLEKLFFIIVTRYHDSFPYQKSNLLQLIITDSKKELIIFVI